MEQLKLGFIEQPTTTKPKVFVYRNLHFKDRVTYSVKNVASGLVVDHSPLVYLTGVKFKVSKAGRERVLRERRKNVHAGVVGDPAPIGLDVFWDDYVRVTYNPYKYESFVRVDTGEPVYSAKAAMIDAQGIWAKL